MDAGHAPWILLIGVILAATAPLQSLARLVRLPTLVGFLALGVLLRLADSSGDLLGGAGREAFAFMADIGLVAILFRVGLHSNLNALIAKLQPALLIWIGNVALSGVLGYWTARHIASFETIPALVIGLAFTATSICVSAAAWEERSAIRSANGQLMLDVAELDDISGVILMALLFKLIPVLQTGDGEIAAALLSTGAGFVVKFAAFATLCFLAARYIERPLTKAAARLEHPPQRMLVVTGAGFMLAAIAGGLGFSLAIGALFAGLVFSRDPQAVKTEARFDDLYAFFAPFFFVGIGLQTDTSMFGDVVTPGLWLLGAAVVGKVLGAGLPALLTTNAMGALLIGVSLIPRAEIALVIAHQGRASGVLPQSAYGMLIFVSVCTCILASWLTQSLLTYSRQPGNRRTRERRT